MDYDKIIKMLTDSGAMTDGMKIKFYDKNNDGKVLKYKNSKYTLKTVISSRQRKTPPNWRANVRSSVASQEAPVEKPQLFFLNNPPTFGGGPTPSPFIAAMASFDKPKEAPPRSIFGGLGLNPAPVELPARPPTIFTPAAPDKSDVETK